MVATGFLAGSLLAQHVARKRGLRPDVFWSLVARLAVGAGVFGHLGYALTAAPAYYFSHPLEFLYVWDGLSSYGGFLGCAVIAIHYFRTEKLDVLKYADVLVVGVAAGWVFGRLGCFFAHDHIGRPLQTLPGWVGSSLGWLAVPFPDNAAAPGVPAALRFDLGLLDSLATAVVLIILLAAMRRPRRPGVLLGTGVILYSGVRFWSDFLRNVDLPSTDPRFAGYTPSQYLALVAIGLGAFAIYMGRQRMPWPAARIATIS